MIEGDPLLHLGFPADTVVKKRKKKNPPSNAGDARDMGSIPGSGRSLGEGNGNLLQHSCLRNPTLVAESNKTESLSMHARSRMSQAVSCP